MSVLVCSIKEEEEYDGRGERTREVEGKIQKILDVFCPNSMAVATPLPLKGAHIPG